MILGSLVYDEAPTFALNRGQLWGLYLAWHPGMVVVTTGNPFVIREQTVGDYSTVIKLPDWVYEYSSKTFELGEVLEDLYVYDHAANAIAPNFGTCLVDFSHHPVYRTPQIGLHFLPVLPNRAYWRVPLMPAGYWNPIFDIAPSDPFFEP